VHHLFFFHSPYFLLSTFLRFFSYEARQLLFLVRFSLVGVLSQKVTYLFCDELDIVSKELRSGVRQATKDVVKSEV